VRATLDGRVRSGWQFSRAAEDQAGGDLYALSPAGVPAHAAEGNGSLLQGY
jgi:hypothetical protein